MCWPGQLNSPKAARRYLNLCRAVRASEENWEVPIGGPDSGTWLAVDGSCQDPRQDRRNRLPRKYSQVGDGPGEVMAIGAGHVVERGPALLRRNGDTITLFSAHDAKIWKNC